MSARLYVLLVIRIHMFVLPAPQRPHMLAHTLLPYQKVGNSCQGFSQGEICLFEILQRERSRAPLHLRHHTLSPACCCTSRALLFWHPGAQLVESLQRGWCRSCPCRARHSSSRCDACLTCFDENRSGMRTGVDRAIAHMRACNPSSCTRSATQPLQVLLLGHRAPQLALASSQQGRLHGAAAPSCCMAGESKLPVVSYARVLQYM